MTAPTKSQVLEFLRSLPTPPGSVSKYLDMVIKAIEADTKEASQLVSEFPKFLAKAKMV